MNNLTVGENVTFGVAVNGLTAGEELDFLLASVAYNNALLGVATVSPGAIVPNPLDFSGFGDAGVAEGSYFPFDPADFISDNGTYFTFDVEVLADGAGQISFTLAEGNLLLNGAPQPAEFVAGGPFRFSTGTIAAVPEPATFTIWILAGGLLLVGGIFTCGRRLRRRPSSRSSSLRVEALEPRQMLAADSTIAEYVGVLNHTGDSEEIAVTVRPGQVGMTNGKALLGFHVTDRDGQGALNPGLMAITPAAVGASAALVYQKADVTAAGDSLVVAELSAGDYVFKLLGATNIRTPFELDIFLVGDADGDQLVTRDDYRALQAAHGAKLGQPHYNQAADANRDGLVNAQDISLFNRAWRNSLLTSAPPLAVGGDSVGDHPPAAVTPTAGYDPQSDQLYFESTTGWVQALSVIDGVHAGVVSTSGVGIQSGYGIQSEEQTTYIFSWDFREAGYNNEVGIYYLDDAATGAIGSIRPGDDGYDSAALADGNYQVLFASGSVTNNQTASTVRQIAADKDFAFYVVQNNTTANHKANPANVKVWFPFHAANQDAYEHFQETSPGDQGYRSDIDKQWKVEDLSPTLPNPQGLVNDADYDDVVLSVRTKTDPPSKNSDFDSTGEQRHAVGHGDVVVETDSGNAVFLMDPTPCSCSSQPTFATGENPHPIIEVDWHLTAAAAAADRLEATLTFGGIVGQTVHYSTAGLAAGQAVRFALQADATTLATGRYDWTLSVKAVDGSEVTERTFHGSHEVFNRTASEFGHRMWVEELDRLTIESDGASLIRGDGTAAWFAKTASGDYATPAGSLSTLTKNGDGSYTLALNDGSRHEFTSSGLLAARVDAHGEARTYAYTDADGDAVSDELASITDRFGRSTTYAYAGGRLASVTDFDGSVTAYGYDGSGRVTSITDDDPDGAGPQTAPTSTYEYDANGLLTKSTDPAGRAAEYTYDFARRLTGGSVDGDAWSLAAAQTQGLVDLSQTGYDASHLASAAHLTAERVAVYTDERGNETRIEHDALGRATSITDELGQTTITERNSDGQVTRIVTPDPDGAGPLGALETTYEYDTRGNLIEAVYADGATESWTYEATFNQVASHTDQLGRVTLYEIDTNTGDVLSQTRVVGAIDDGVNLETDDVTTSFTYTDGAGDLPAGLLLSMTDALGVVTAYAYYDDALAADFGRLFTLTAAAGTADEAVTTYAYDAAGNLTSETDPLGRETVYAYDALDRLVATTLPDPDGASGAGVSPVTTYAYCTCGTLTGVTDDLGNVTAYEYDEHSRVIETTAPDPDGAGPLTAPVTSYTYDAAGNLATVTDPLGRTTEYEYDELNRLVSTILPDPDGASGTGVSPVTSQSYNPVGWLASETDALGNATLYTYDAMGRVLSIAQADPDGVGPGVPPVTSYTYDAAGQLLTTTDPLGRVTTYAYDALGRVASITSPDPDGGGPAVSPVTSFTYDKLNNLLTETDALGNVTTYAYDNLYRLIEVTQPDPDGVGPGVSPATSYVYDDASQLVSMTDPLGRVTRYAYDNLGRLIETTLPDPDGVGPLASPVYSTTYDAVGNVLTETDPLGNVTAYEYDNLYRLVEVTQPDPDGAGPLASPVTTYSYDAAGQLVSMTDPLSRVTSYDYDDLGRLISTTLPDPDGAGALASPVFSTAYDAHGNVTSETDALGSVTSYSYDDLHRLIQVTQPDPDGVGPGVSPVTSYAYDAAGQLLTTTDPLARVTSYEYDNLGRLTKQTEPDPDGGGSALAAWMVFTYDAMGNVLSEANRLGHTTSYAYDNLYRLTESTDANGEETAFTYDLVGNRLSLTDPGGNTTEWVYDGLDRVVEEVNELNDSRYFAYNAVGSLVEKTDRNGRVTEYEYDNLHRRTAEIWLDGMSVVRTIAFEYDAAGQLTSADDPAAEISYVYDQLGRATTIATDHAALADDVVLSQAFDANSRRTSLAAAIGGTDDFLNAFAYDNLHRLTRLTQAGQAGGSAVAEKRIDFAYLADGRYDEIRRYADLAGTEFVASSVYGYDSTGRLTSLTHAQNSTTFSGYGWTYDAANRITGFTNSAHAAEDATYSYDDIGQLSGADRSGTSSDESYAYDENGNRTTTGYATGEANRLTSDGTFSYQYDAEGNRNLRTRISSDPANDKSVEYEWDHRNRLTKVTYKNNSSVVTKAVKYEYDAFNCRIGKTVDTDGDGDIDLREAYIWADYEKNAVLDFVDADLDGTLESSEVKRRYLWGARVDEFFAQENIDSFVSQVPEDVAWALTDNQGSVRDLAVYDAGPDTTTIDVHYTLDTYGNIISGDETATRYIYTAQEYDLHTGEWYYDARWYSSYIGRFMLEDFIPDNPINTYVYVTNSPTNATDANGLQELANDYAPYGNHDVIKPYTLSDLPSEYRNNPIDYLFHSAQVYVRSRMRFPWQPAKPPWKVEHDHVASAIDWYYKPMCIAEVNPIVTDVSGAAAAKLPAAIDAVSDGTKLLSKTDDAAALASKLDDSAAVAPVLSTGTFSIRGWLTYPPGIPQPKGPFRLLTGDEYEAARKSANAANAAIRKADPAKYKGLQIHEIHPVKFGGSPTDPANKIALTPSEHARVTAWWNCLMRQGGD